MNRIKKLPKSSAHLLSCTQIVTSIHCVIKELIENSLDASASCIEVKLDNFGLDKIEVKDNGVGIREEDVPLVAKPGCTSKISSHSDLLQLDTYGFRGEALSALCSVSDLAITTMTEGDKYGRVHVFTHSGDCLSTKPHHSTRGTTISALNLFKTTPVRRQIYRSEKNKREELKKVEEVLISFGCIHIGVKFFLTHNKCLIWQKPSVSHVKDGLLLLFGNSAVENMDFSQDLDAESRIDIEAYLPKREAPASCGHVSSSRSVVSINKRPVRVKAIDKVLKECYKYSQNHSPKLPYPVCFISIVMPSSLLDVNLEPNKTSVAISNSELLLERLSRILQTVYGNDANGEASVTTAAEKENSETNHKSEPIGLKPSKPNTDVQMKKSDIVVIPPKFTGAVKTCTGRLQVAGTKTLSDQSPHPNGKRRKLSALDSHIQTLDAFLSSSRALHPSQTDDTVVELLKSPTSDVHSMAVPSRVAVYKTSTVNTEKCDATKGISKAVSLSSEVAENAAMIDDSRLTVNNISEVQHCPGKTNIAEVDDVRLSLFGNGLESNGSGKADNVILKESVASPTFSARDWSRGVLPMEKPLQPVEMLASNSITEIQDKPPADLAPISERKVTSFEIFCRVNRLEVASMNPQASNREIAQLLTERWSDLPQTEKAGYEKMVNIHCERLKKEKRPGSNIKQKLTNKKLAPNNIPVRIFEELRFSFEELKEFFAEDYQSKSCLPESPVCDVVNSVEPGIWICLIEKEIFLLNTFRLQEAIFYCRLLQTFHFVADTLEDPVSVSKCFLGEELCAILQNMQSSSQDSLVSIEDGRITSNGFGVTIHKESEDIQIVAVTNLIPSYGVSDLKEILYHVLCHADPESVPLSKCRPAKIVSYLQAEAVRIARLSPLLKDKHAVLELLTTARALPLEGTTCIHNEPFLHKLCSYANDDTC